MKEISENDLKNVSGGVYESDSCAKFQQSCYASLVNAGETVCKNCKYFVITGDGQGAHAGGICTKK